MPMVRNKKSRKCTLKHLTRIKTSRRTKNKNRKVKTKSRKPSFKKHKFRKTKKYKKGGTLKRPNDNVTTREEHNNRYVQSQSDRDRELSHRRGVDDAIWAVTDGWHSTTGIRQPNNNANANLNNSRTN